MEVKLTLPSCGEIRGKWWGPTNVQPILCFHGWQDNCGVFDRLIPLLPKEFGYLALDIPGHGLSSFTPGTHYGALDSLLFIENVRMLYGWEKVMIIGHSMMASLAFTYAAVCPDRTQFVIFLDNLVPFMQSEMDDYLRVTIDKLHLENERLNSGQEPPSYEYDDLVDRIYMGSFQSVDKEHCKYLISRGVAPSNKYPGKYYFKRDARVKYFFYMRLQLEQNIYLASKITAPSMYLYGAQSPASLKMNMSYTLAVELKKTNPKFSIEQVPGNHHFLLNNPDTCSKVISRFIYEWSVQAKNKL